MLWKSDLLSERNRSAKNNKYVIANVETENVRGDVENIGADWTERINDPKESKEAAAENPTVTSRDSLETTDERSQLVCRLQESWDTFCWLEWRSQLLSVRYVPHAAHFWVRIQVSVVPQALQTCWRVTRRFVPTGNTMFLWLPIWALCLMFSVSFLIVISAGISLVEMQIKNCTLHTAVCNYLKGLTPSASGIHRSFIAGCIVVCVCVCGVFLVSPPDIMLGKGWMLAQMGVVCFWEHSSYQISQINSPVWLLKWKLNILPTRKTNLEIHF